nr:MAG TPA: hypothetical protein [Caudoviricetes sp.]
MRKNKNFKIFRNCQRWGVTPLPNGSAELHAVTVHFFSRQILKMKGE